MIDRNAIFSSNDITFQKFYVPEWKNDTFDGTVYIRVLTGTERDKLESMFKDGITKMYARFAMMVCCQENGDKLFHDDDVDLLNKKSSVALVRIWDFGCKLNKIGKNAFEEELKN